VTLSLGGGAEASAFPAAVSSRSRIDKLVANCTTLIHRTYPNLFEGIDVDWEGPRTSAQREQFTELMQALRRALGRRALLTAAVTPSFSIDWRRVARVLSWFNLMTYDLHGPWGDPVTDFLAPLRPDPRDPEYSAANSVTADAVALVRRFDVPAAKVVLGIPFYGRGYSGVRAANHGLYQRYRGVDTSGGDGLGAFYYRDLLSRYVGKQGFRAYGPDRHSGEMWLYKPGRTGGDFISYDGIWTIAAKAKLIRSMRLGGAMIWDIAFDTGTPRTSLTDALYRQLRQ
jgi:chitinase